MERSYVERHNKLRILCTTLCKNSNFIEAGVVGGASLVFIDHLRKMPVDLTEISSAPKLKVVAK
jgi:hypothetical protein